MNQVGELTSKLDSVDPHNVDNFLVNSLVDDCNGIIINAAKNADMVFETVKSHSTSNKKFKVNRKSYFDSNCHVKRKEYRRAKKYFQRVRSDVNHNDMVSKGKEYKKALQKQFKAHQKSFISKIRELRSTDPKSYWRLLNKGSKRSKETANLVALDTFFEHFKELNNDKVDIDFDMPTNIPEYNSLINQKISEKEVVDAVQSPKNNKACSNDMILNEFLKHSVSRLLPVFVRIFNIVFESGVVPDSWASGIICPIFKNKGDPANVDNYRGITILSCLGKLFTCILNNRLSGYLENSGILCEEQAGFRKGYGTVDHIFNLKCLVDLYVARGQKLYCAFIDYKKAFDSVNRVLL